MNLKNQQELNGPSSWVVQHATQVPSGMVLDLACGGGRHGRLFLDLGYRVTFLDRDVSRVADLGVNKDAKILEYDLENGAPWPFESDQFSGIIVVNYLHRPLLARLEESLKKGGVLIYRTFAQGNERYGRPANPDFLLAPGELRAFFGQSMEVIDFQEGFLENPDRVVQSICAIKH